MNEEEFSLLCQDFIKWQKKVDKGIKYADKSDLAHLFRFISGSTNAYRIIHSKR